MMRKAISLFLAVSALCFATSALATDISTGTVSGNVRNGDTSMPTSDSDTSTMPCFRTGDTISFTVSGVTSGNELTLISYKAGSDIASLTDAQVQYINQYTLSGDQVITYKIREQASGVYVVKINDERGTAATFYYKIGNVTMSTITSGGIVASPAYGTPYISYDYGDEWSIAFIGKATIDCSADVVKFGELGAVFGFEFADTSSPKSINGKKSSESEDVSTVSGNTLDSFFEEKEINLEVNGSYSVVYGLTLYNIPEGQQGNITARAVMD